MRTLGQSAELTFFDKVYIVVRMIPRGRVASYGQIATYLGHPRAARTVGWALHGIPEGSDVPWQRVINAKGRITIPQYQALLILNKEEDLSMSEMANALCITTAAATSMVDNLTRQKLVARRRSTKDRRVVRVSLTQRGSEVLEGVKDEMYRLILSVMEKLSPRERSTWVELYEKIRTLVEEGA